MQFALLVFYFLSACFYFFFFGSFIPYKNFNTNRIVYCPAKPHPHTLLHKIGAFCGKLVEEYRAGNVMAACVLVNNATETRWFQSLCGAASAICFPSGRVRFWNPSKEAAPLQGQAVLFLGDDMATFKAAFSKFGVVCHVV